MRVLVTGGAGFIGLHVARALLDRGDSVVIVDNFNDYYDPRRKEERILRIPEANVIRGDVADAEFMKTVFEQHVFDRICHLAAQAGVRYSIEQPLIYEHANVRGMLVILEMARKHNVSLVYASSSSVYGNNAKVPFSEADPVNEPISLYAATKRSCELMAYTYHHLYGVQSTGLRFFTVYGPWGRPDMAPLKFVESISKGQPIDVYGNGDMARDFTYIVDIVTGVLAALDTPFPYEIFNLGGDNPVRLLDFIAAIEQALGKKAIMHMLPLQSSDVKVTMADISKAKKRLGFSPKTGIGEGMRLVADWYRTYCTQDR
ncbi:MAG: NAD-dependent epimerase/dehydratase family protein [archaeon]